jgi:hypothetical protein
LSSVKLPTEPGGASLTEPHSRNGRGTSDSQAVTIRTVVTGRTGPMSGSEPG